jgi:hypothetical protein
MCDIARSARNAAILRRVRRRALVTLSIACFAAAGCGSSEVHRIAAWRTGPPYIPPPEPTRKAPARQTVERAMSARQRTRGSMATVCRLRAMTHIRPSRG